MGTYGYSAKELTDVLVDALDKVEGDFDTVTLNVALDKCREYQHVTDYHPPKKPTKFDKCPECKGRGTIPGPSVGHPLDHEDDWRIPCFECRGTGKRKTTQKL